MNPIDATTNNVTNTKIMYVLFTISSFDCSDDLDKNDRSNDLSNRSNSMTVMRDNIIRYVGINTR